MVWTGVNCEHAPFNQFTLAWRSSVDKFAIDSRTGVITTTQTLDHELQVNLHVSSFFSTSYLLTVTTSATVGGSTVSTVVRY